MSIRRVEGPTAGTVPSVASRCGPQLGGGETPVAQDSRLPSAITAGRSRGPGLQSKLPVLARGAQWAPESVVIYAGIARDLQLLFRNHRRVPPRRCVYQNDARMGQRSQGTGTKATQRPRIARDSRQLRHRHRSQPAEHTHAGISQNTASPVKRSPTGSSNQRERPCSVYDVGRLRHLPQRSFTLVPELPVGLRFTGLAVFWLIPACVLAGWFRWRWRNWQVTAIAVFVAFVSALTALALPRSFWYTQRRSGTRR